MNLSVLFHLGHEKGLISGVSLMELPGLISAYGLEDYMMLGMLCAVVMLQRWAYLASSLGMGMGLVTTDNLGKYSATHSLRLNTSVLTGASYKGANHAILINQSISQI